jgi:hypothetical protein
MKLRVKRSGPVFFLAIALLLGAVGACGHDIGDDCKSSVDCDPNGTRSCDLSQPGGYCTIVGCAATTCPSGATCIRLFPEQFLTTQCDPATEDQDQHCTNIKDPTTCGPVQRTDNCTADEICLDAGVCAKMSSEQRLCTKACSNNGDCRSGYECRQAGDHGSMVLATDPTVTTKFCAPQVPVTPMTSMP